MTSDVMALIGPNGRSIFATCHDSNTPVKNLSPTPAPAPVGRLTSNSKPVRWGQHFHETIETSFFYRLPVYHRRNKFHMWPDLIKSTGRFTGCYDSLKKHSLNNLNHAWFTLGWHSNDMKLTLTGDSDSIQSMPGMSYCCAGQVWTRHYVN